MRRVLALGLIALATSAVLLGGCGKSSSDVVAKVGDTKITTDDFNYIAPAPQQTFATAQDEFDNRRAALDTVINTRLLVQAAYEKKLDQQEEVARVILANKDKFLLDVLYQKEVIEKATVSDAEIRDFYNHLNNQVRVSHILASTEDSARMIFDRVKGGENFEQLAYDLSKDPSAKRNRGDMGYFLWGAMVDEFQDVAFKMEVGEVSPPVKTRFGYHIIKLVDKKPNDQLAEFDKMKENIKGQLITRKRYQLTEAYFVDIRKRYPITVDSSTCQYVLHKRENLYPPQLLAAMPKSDFDDEQLDRNEKDLVIATWGETGQVTLFDYLTSSRQFPVQMKPDLDDYDSVAAIIFELKKPEILAYQAAKEGIENDPEFKRKMQIFKELSMADIMRNDSMFVPQPPTEENIRAYYDAHPEEYSIPARAHVYEILLSDEMLATKLTKEISSIKDFQEKAMDLTERPGKRTSNGELGWVERTWFPEIFDAAWKTSVGAIGGPVATQGKYSIFYVADKMEAQMKDYIAVKREIASKISADKKKELYTQWLADRRAKTDVEVYEDALWSTIDKNKYAATGGAEAPKTN